MVGADHKIPARPTHQHFPNKIYSFDIDGSPRIRIGAELTVSSHTHYYYTISMKSFALFNAWSDRYWL